MTFSPPGESTLSLDLPTERVGQLLGATRDHLSALLDAALDVEVRAQARRGELEEFLEVLALDSALIAGDASEGYVEGTRINLDAMRSDVVRLAQEATRATTLRSNIETVMDLLSNATEHFASDLAYTAALDASDERLNAAMVAAREEERRRLSREIHDGPAQVLTNAIYAIQIVEQIARRSPQHVGEELARVRDLLKDGVTEVRRFMFDLRPTMLQDQGLGPTLRRYIDDYRRFFGRTVELHLDPDLPTLSAEQDLTIFRIMQEALQNIHKHAGVTATSWVSLRVTEGGVSLEIRDDGGGFNPTFATALHGSGSGLPGIRERAQLIGAALHMTSIIGEGTTILLQIETDARIQRVRASAIAH